MHYRWRSKDGMSDESGRQVLQLVGGTNKFRNMCGKLLVEKLNTIERGKEKRAPKTDAQLRIEFPEEE